MSLHNLHPARDEAEARRRRESIELCGKNRGPHDYIPIEWKFIGSSPEKSKRVTRLLCRTCFSNISVSTILENYPDVS
jgi:hypothetical protein